MLRRLKEVHRSGYPNGNVSFSRFQLEGVVNARIEF